MSRRFRHRMEAALFWVVSLLLSIVSRRRALAMGAGLGRWWARLDARHVRIASENLHCAFPGWDAARVDHTARGVYAHFGGMLFDILWLGLRPKETMLDGAKLIGREHVDAAYAAGKGILFVTAHFGNWELHAAHHSLVSRSIGVVARPLDNPLLDARLVAFRSRGGNTVIYKRQALGRVLKMIRAGEGVAILIDQNVQASDGIFVDFFGRPAATTTVAAAVAVKTGCALIPVRSILHADGRYSLIYEPPVTWSASGDRQADIAAITQSLTTRIETWIREYPDQWLWLHRRWKTRPPGERTDEAS